MNEEPNSTKNTYDVIIIGARCAGSSTAMLLGRMGYQVLLLEKDPFPSDRTMSTHMIWHAGSACLEKWGLLDSVVKSGATPMRKLNLDMGAFVLSGYAKPYGGAQIAIAPRRVVIDKILTDAAVQAGVEFRPESKVEEIIIEDGRVCGVRFKDKEGNSIEERAKLLIGADGTHSVVARAVQAEEYNDHPRHQGTIWAYFDDLEIDEMEFYSRPGRMVYAWQTNHQQVLAGICFRYEDFPDAKTNADEVMPQQFSEHATADFAERVASARQTTPWLSGSSIGVIRKPVGPGWALIGDAGLTIDPISAAGISNAFLDAELLAELLDHGLKSGSDSPEDALSEFEEKRNADRVGFYEFTKEMSKLEDPVPEMVDLFTALQHSPEGIENYFGLFAQSVKPEEFFSPEHVEKVFQEATAASDASKEAAA